MVGGFVLSCIFPCVLGVRAVITAEIYPKEINIAYDQSATLSCITYVNVVGIVFVVSNVSTSMWASRGISQSATTFSGINTITNITVLGTMANNGLQITCRVFVPGGASYFDTSPPAVVIIEGW